MFKIILFVFLYFFSTSLYSLTIKETIKSTIENNPKIKIGLEKINESKEIVVNASGELLPDISSTISGTYESSTKESSTSKTQDDTFSDKYKLTISQNLYDAGYDQLEIERSEILLDNEILNFKILVENLILDAISGYLTVLNYETSLENTNKNFESMTKILEEINTMYNADAATLYDLKSAESSFAMAETNLFLAQQNLSIGKKSFKRIVGLDAIDLETIININSNLNLNEIEENALNNNLSLQLLKNDIKNKEILLLKEKKTKKPNLDLTGTAEYSETDRIDGGTETLKSNVALTLTIPIFQQGIDDSNIRKYYSQILQAELNLQDAEEDLLIFISSAFKDFKISESKMNANKFSIEASEIALKSLKQEYLIGTKTISDYLIEEERFLNLKVDYSNAKKDFFDSYFKIKSLEGNLLKVFDEFLPELN
jgi:outer membrane protein TolC